MRLVGFLAGTAGRSSFSYQWQPGACAVLWRACAEGSEEAMGMTSPTTSLKRGASPTHLQALHDQAPPTDSQMIRRVTRPSEPSHPSYGSYKSR
jgi:hypothetical protein